jgi:hypothetical protein
VSSGWVRAARLSAAGAADTSAKREGTPVRQGTPMTEAAWRDGADPLPMLRYLLSRPVSERKLRLFGCALLWRHLREINHPRCREAIEVAEAFAEGRADLATLRLAHAAARNVAHWTLAHTQGNGPRVQLQWHLRGAVRDVAQPGIVRSLHQALVALIRAARLADAIAYPFVGNPLAAARSLSRAQAEAERAQAVLLREVFGNPFRPVVVDPAWLTFNGGTVRELAALIHAEEAFGQMPILADALEDAGCADPALLDHCRAGGAHVRGCWVVDLLLGKE